MGYKYDPLVDPNENRRREEMLHNSQYFQENNIAAREPRMFVGRMEFEPDNHDAYDVMVNLIDWNRVLIQAYGQHARVHGTEPNPICGECIKTVLLRTDE